MSILVYDERSSERDAIVVALQRSAVCVQVVVDAKALFTAITEPHDAVIHGFRGPVHLETVRTARASCPASYLIAVIDSSAEIPALLAAGAQDFVRRPVAAEEIVARVAAPKRVEEWVRASAPFDHLALSGWNDIGAVVAQDLSEMLGHRLVAVEGAAFDWSSCVRSAAITMSLTKRHVEMRVSLAADRAALGWLTGLLLGDGHADQNATDDVLRELTNMAGGGLKRTLAKQLTLTTGLPKSGPAAAPRTGRFSSWLLSKDVLLALIVEVRRRENLRVPASKLSEGMVLVADLRNESGALLAAAGTRLTSTTAQRVGQILGEECIVEVADAA